MEMGTIEDKPNITQEAEEEATQEEEEDPWTTRDGMKGSPQEEEEEDRTGSKRPGKKTRTNRELTESKTCNQEVAETPTPTEVTEIMMWVNIIPLIMGIQEKEKGAQVPEDIQTGTSAQEEAKTEEEEIETTVQEVTEVTEMVEMVGGSKATTAEETARGP